jgi:phenylpyruvate tautomerase PptA (4-oxalocrotonate tautomerase family)
VVERLTAIAADAAGDPALADRTWVLLTEAPDGGWGLAGHANTNEELVAAARRSGPRQSPVARRDPALRVFRAILKPLPCHFAHAMAFVFRCGLPGIIKIG